MKQLLILICTVGTLTGFSQNTDTGNLSYRRNSIGVTGTVVDVYYWIPGVDANTEWSDGPKTYKVKAGLPAGITYQYRLFYAFTLQTGIQYAKENYEINNVYTFDRGILNVNYAISYLKIPINIRFYPNHLDTKRRGGFFLQLGASVDFITKADVKSTSTYTGDPHFNYPSSTYVTTRNELHSRKLQYNKVTPMFMIGNEIGENRFSFFYAGALQSPGIDQFHNTQEFFMNIQASLVVGFNYRF